MKSKSVSFLNRITLAGLIAIAPAGLALAQSDAAAPTPDKCMTAAQESFVKGDMDKAGASLHQAAVCVKKESESVADDAKTGVKNAGEALSKLGDDVKKGTVKSDAELKKTFGQVDHTLAAAWHKTAVEAKKSGKDSSEALRKSAVAVENAARWSGVTLKEGTQKTIAAVKSAGEATGKGIKAGTDEVDSWFKDLGDSIAHFGHNH